VQQRQAGQGHRAGHLDGDLPAGPERGGVGADGQRVAGDVLAGQGSLRGGVRLRDGGGWVAGYGGGAGGLDGRAVDLQPRVGQPAGGDDQQQDHDEQGGDQDQLGGG
jgi:hypothetical protein